MMRSGTSFEQGEVILIPFPFTDLGTSKQRPVLVMSKTSVNHTSRDFICCGITSNIQNSDRSILIDNNDLERGYLPKLSCVKLGVVFTLEKSLAIKSIGKIRENSLTKIKDEFLKLF